MKSPRLPFVEFDGRAYLVVNFDLSPRDIPPLPELLDGLLNHHDAEDILLLRPLTEPEAELLREYRRDLEVEAWARIVHKNEARFRGLLKGNDDVE